MPTTPETASEAAMPSWWNWLPAATRTDWPLPAPVTLLAQVAPQLTCTPVPSAARVVAVRIATDPERLIDAVPLIPALKPTVARLSELVAVTATPRNGALPALALPGVIAVASPELCSFCDTTLCEVPVAALLSSTRKVLARASALLAASLISWAPVGLPALTGATTTIA